jgi:hypothetical protein
MIHDPRGEKQGSSIGVPLQKPRPLAILSRLQFGSERKTEFAVISSAFSREWTKRRSNPNDLVFTGILGVVRRKCIH